MNDRWKDRARALVGARRVELEEWAHEAKIGMIAGALHTAYEEGRRDMKEQCMIVVDTCIDRDPTLHKLNACFAEIE